VLVVEDQKQLDKVLEIKDNLSHLKAVVMWSGKIPEGVSTDKVPVYSWDDFMALGRDVADHDLQERIDAQKPGNCCTLIYTSGTTGNPKAVMISHDNITWTAQRLAEHAGLQLTNERIVSYLPLSHIAAQIVDIHGPMAVAGTSYFAKPTALKGTIVETLNAVRPTLFLGVPRVWEKFEEKLKAVGAANTGLKKKLSTWAKDIGLRGSYAIQRGESTPWGWTIANTLLKKVKVALGLDQCRYFATAAAPIQKETLEYFLSLTIPVMEVYGMSENSGPMTVSRNGEHRTGSTGKAMGGVELKIDNPDEEGNGEICMRGRHVMMGYLFNEEKTKETIDSDGWLHTGDIGKLDDDGFLYITGRIKELIITAGGENVAPVPIEDRMKQEVPIIANAMVIGDKKKFLSILITLKSEVDPETTVPLDELTADTIKILEGIGSTAKTVTEAAQDDKVKAYIEEGMQRANEAAVSRAQKVQKFTILPADFSIPGGELGPTLKLRRPIVVKKYAAEIDAMY
jgi:long-chain-fatty-acid--CoA ligase ACSBG